MHVEDTIVATASAHQSGGLRGIVRLSGPHALSAVMRCFQPADDTTDVAQISAPTRIQGVFHVREPIGAVDCALHLWPTERSYTRQPTAEFHTWGPIPLLNAIVETLCGLGARLARPGEFTLRAFLAGRMDLAQAEAVLGVIDSVDDRELSVALQQLAGGLSEPLDQLRNTLLNLCADLEAGLDFVEEDIEFVSHESVQTELQTALKIIDATRRRMQARRGGDQLPRVTLVGEPNSGKSTLWNAMCGDGKAIVTDQAGTTRDYLTGTVRSASGDFTLIDTAGVEHGEDALSTTLRDTTYQQHQQADLILLCIDGSRPPSVWESNELESEADDRIVVLTKSDQCSAHSLNFDLATSSFDNSSIRGLIAMCGEKLSELGMESSVVASTAVRCSDSLNRARGSLETALQLSNSMTGDELVAAELRCTLDALGEIVGVIYTDDILDRVFSRFCIGK